MSEGRMELEEKSQASLTQEQRRLVAENLGLVGVHLRQHVRNHKRLRRSRQRQDLYQEGCLGLIRAAAEYRAERGIPFAAFALPRIHNAVSQLLYAEFGGAPRPHRRRERDAASARPRERHDPTCPPFRRRRGGRRADLPRGPDLDREDGPTVGQRLGEKYERAVRAAARAVCGRASPRGDRAQLVRLLIEERYLIPREDSRRPLRQIARETRSSFARVAECDRCLGDAVRAALESDPEFVELRRVARTDRVGRDRAIDEELDRRLAQASAVEFIRRFRAADGAARLSMLAGVLDVTAPELEALIQERIESLPPAAREFVVGPASEVAAAGPGRRKTRPNHAAAADGPASDTDPSSTDLSLVSAPCRA